MKRICSFVSILMLVTLAATQLVQAAHHHDGLHHFTKHSHSSSQEDLQLADAGCFICTFHSKQNSNAAILPTVFTLAHYMATPLVLQAELDCAIKFDYPRTSYNRGPPLPTLLSF